MSTVEMDEYKSMLKRSNVAYNKGDYSDAESLLREALFHANNSNHTIGVAIALNNLGTVLSSMGRYEEAISVLSEALSYKQVHGLDKRSEASTLNQLALLYSTIGDYKKSEDLYMAALSYTQEHGDKSAELTTLSNLASVYTNTEKYERAEEILLRVLKMQEQLGDSQLAFTYNSLGKLYFQKSQNDKSLYSYEKALEMLEREYGVNHPDTNKVLSNIAAVLAKIGKHSESELVMKRALTSLRSVLGSTHPYVKALEGGAVTQDD